MRSIQRATSGALVLFSAIALGGCMYDGYGSAGVSVGNGHYGGYGYDPYYSGYGNGWYDGYYYPGSGYYVYDRKGSRHRWNTRQRDYWANHGHDRKHGYDRDRGDRDHDRVDRQRWRDRDRDSERPRYRADRDRPGYARPEQNRDRPSFARPDRDRGDSGRSERGNNSRNRER